MELMVHSKKHYERMYNFEKVPEGEVVMMNQNPEKVVAIGELDIEVRCEKTGKLLSLHFARARYVPRSKYVILGWRAFQKRVRKRTGGWPSLNIEEGVSMMEE
jgi:hypothetical protein